MINKFGSADPLSLLADAKVEKTLYELFHDSVGDENAITNTVLSALH